jgi:hypothetical protein
MHGLHSYDYAYVRVVPHIDREEFLNVGVILFCRTQRFLEARLVLDEARLAAFAPKIKPHQVREHLDLVPQICAGRGPIGELGQAESFHWLVAPHNTLVQCSPVHSGLCTNPREALEKLVAGLAR